MSRKETYTGIDYFRVIAAFLIIAIHTSPLTTYSETADFILTRTIARVGVPFFFMTSGFFLLSEYGGEAKRVVKFIKKTILIYLASILFYIPLNCYNGYFEKENLFSAIIKDILFNGTLYHLWYLPAAIIGIGMTWLLLRKFGLKKTVLFTVLLYLIGMFGDSYFGAIEKIPVIKNIYVQLFQLFDYTRNGLFFAPIFFSLGAVMASEKVRISLKSSCIGFGIMLLLMIGEGLLLHNLKLQKHDSMYLMLLPCVYFLFSALTYWKGCRKKELGKAALLLYIVHPMMIVVVRMAAKMAGLEKSLIENSLIHYIAVSLASAIFCAVFLLTVKGMTKKRKRHTVTKTAESEFDRAWIELNLDNLRHNAEVLQQIMPKGCKLMAVVKAEAYGHGSAVIAEYLNRIGVRAFAVATLDEGIVLRKSGILGEILIMGYTNPKRAKEIHKYDMTQTLIDFPYAASLNRQGYRIKVHIKIDTGMHRLGFSLEERVNVLKINRAKNFVINGIYTHLCVADSNKTEDVVFTQEQIAKFTDFIETLSQQGMKIPKIHIQSSYGLLNYRELSCDYARIGIALYGVLSNVKDKTKIQPDLRPVLSLKAKIILIRDVKKGECIGYGRTYQAERDSRIAIIPIGYADGLPRNLGKGNAEVLVKGKRVPIAGRICMDVTAIDITDAAGVEIQDTVTIIGKDGKEELNAAQIAEDTQTITNELLSRMGRRLKVI